MDLMGDTEQTGRSGIDLRGHLLLWPQSGVTGRMLPVPAWMIAVIAAHCHSPPSSCSAATVTPQQ